MDLVVALDHRLDRTPDGAVWTPNVFTHAFWSRYLRVFDHVRVVARIRDVDSPKPGWKRSDGSGVSFVQVPYYVGPKQFLFNAWRVKRAVSSAVGPHDAVILRAASQMANSLEVWLRKSNHPYGVEVINDPYDVYGPGVVEHPLRPFLRWWFPSRLRRQCANAIATSYVTQEALQRRYPCPAHSVGVSDANLTDDAFVASPRPPKPDAKSFHLMMVGTITQLYKAPDVLIDAVTLCVREGMDLKLTLIGDGKYQPYLEERATALGMRDRIIFRGLVPAGWAVRNELDQADLFILASRTEGLPRAIIEAQARGVPCIGSTVGGIPELLAPEDLVPPGDARALAGKIREVLSDPDRMARMSERNLEKAREYQETILSERRTAFYQYLRNKTEEWVEATASSRQTHEEEAKIAA